VHIAFVTHAYPRWHGDVAGNFLHRLARALSDRGTHITVIAPADRGRAGTEELDGIEIRRVRYAPAAWEVLAYGGTMVEGTSSAQGKLAAVSLAAALAREIGRLAREEPLDLVHAHWWIPAGIAARLARLAGAPPYVVTLHGTDVRLLRGGVALRGLGRRVLRDAAAVTAVSTFLAEGAAAAGLESKAVVVQPMPADLAGFERRSSGGDGILTVGRLAPQKRIDLILSAVAELHREGIAPRLSVIGDGPERSALEARALELGIAGTTRFVGAVPPHELPAAMGNPDVFAFAAREEGLGLVVAEAFFLGVPVVAMAGGGGAADLVRDGAGGTLVADGEVHAFAEAIRACLADPESRSRAARYGDDLKRRFEPATAAEGFEALYRRVSGRDG